MYRSEAMEHPSYLELRLHKAAQEILVHGVRHFQAGVEEVQDVDWGVIDRALSNGWRHFGRRFQPLLDSFVSTRIVQHKQSVWFVLH